MLRLFQRCGCLLLVMLLALSARAYSLRGPVANGGDAWQVPNIGYGTLPGCIGGGFVGAPKNLGEEFRWNVPTFYYAFDQNFLDYFGSNGVVVLEQMFVMLSNHLSAAPLSSWSADLSEFPLYTTRINYTAQALQIYDFKSVTLGTMMQELGLADPTEWVWTLRARVLLGNAKCPDYTYSVIQRNFDPVTPQPSKYINGTLFTYTIFQGDCAQCNNALTLNRPVDPLAVTPSAVASDTVAFGYGGFYTGLTRDDMGGLRYLMVTNNMNVEAVDANSLLLGGGFTNRNVQQLLTSLDLNALVQAAVTNDAAGLQALYPGLLIADTVGYFAYQVTTNFTGSFVSYPYDPAGVLHFAVTTTYTTNVVQHYKHTFLNVFTNTSKVGAYVTTLSASNSFYAWAVPGGVTTNVLFAGTKSTTVIDTNQLSGDFFLIPTNQCGLAILYPILTNVVVLTNQSAGLTNTLTVGATNNTGQFSQSSVTYFTNHTVVINPVDCQATGYANGVALRQGIDQMFFIRHDYDSLLGQYFSPVTNTYQLTSIQGNQPAVQTYRRVVGQPDILLTAQDLGTVGGPAIVAAFTDGNYDTANVLPNLAGPGRRVGPITFTYNKVGQVLVNQGAAFITELDAVSDFVWGTYDLSTNAPIIFPNGNDITQLENQVLMQIVTTNIPAGVLPNATNGVAYAPVVLRGSGGTQPYTWSLASFSLSGLPNGMTLTAANNSGVISSGANLVTGNIPGIYDITVQMTDAGGRSVVRDFTLTVH